MESLTTYLVLIITALSYIAVATIASRKVSTANDYLLGDRQFKTFSISITLIATQLGAGMLLGTSQEAYYKGFMGLAYNLGMAIGFILLALGIAAKLRSANVSTTAELFELKYGSKGLRKFAAFLSVCTMAGILAAQIIASRQLFGTLFGLPDFWLIIFWLVVICYTMFGGIRAIIATDMLQVFLIVSIFSVALFYVVPLPDLTNLLTAPPPISSLPTNSSWMSFFIMPIIFSFIEQDLAQRFFAAKNKRVATNSAIIAAVFLILFSFVPLLLGMSAKSAGIIISNGESPLIALLQSELGPVAMAFIACALLAAICSTADSLLGAASTNLISDFGKQNSKKSLWVSRLITLLVGIGALVVAYQFNNVISLLTKSYEISVSALFVPMMASLYLKSPKKMAAILSVTIGSIIFLLGSLTTLPLPRETLALFGSGLGFIIGQWAGPKIAAR
jgi:SSS family solute:Na+ symporter